MKHFFISLLTICLSFFITLFIIKDSDNLSSSLSNLKKKTTTNKNSIIDTTESDNIPKEAVASESMDFSELLADHDLWKKYHKENIDLSSDFIGVDLDGNEISKKDFLEKLKTGNYVPIKLYDAEYMYQLYRIGSDADEKTSKSIKSTSNTIYNYLLKEGKPFPDFNFKDLNGNQYTKNDLLGSTVVIKCWFIQCKTCVEEFPKINDLYDRYESNGNVVFLSLAFDKPNKLKAFLTKKEFRYPVIAEQKKFMKNEMDVIQYPTHLIIDQYGDIKKMVNNIDSLILSLDAIINGNLIPEEQEF